MEKVGKVLEGLKKNKEKKEMNESKSKKKKNKIFENAVTVEKVMTALANKRGNEYTDQIDSVEEITDVDGGYVVKFTMISGDATEKTGDFLTDEEINNVEVNRGKENESNENDEENEEEVNEEDNEENNEEKSAKDIIENVKKKRKLDEGSKERVEVLDDMRNIGFRDSELLDAFAQALSDDEFFDTAKYILRMEGTESALDLRDEIDNMR